jgi:hypothetical protein
MGRSCALLLFQQQLVLPVLPQLLVLLLRPCVTAVARGSLSLQLVVAVHIRHFTAVPIASTQCLPLQLLVLRLQLLRHALGLQLLHQCTVGDLNNTLSQQLAESLHMPRLTLAVALQPSQ